MLFTLKYYASLLLWRRYALRLRAGLRQQGRESSLAFPGVHTPGYPSFGPAGLAGTGTRLLKSRQQSFVAAGLGEAHRGTRG